ncbi:MAG: dephospho-CoA kinase [Myxococcota bacterium]
MLRVGLTGGIASGKSTVASMLSDAGFFVLDADDLARRAVEPGSPGLDAIRRRFGDVVREDGSLDREALGRIVFSDPEARNDLNRIVHPEVRRRARAAMEAAEARGEPVAIYDVPLLFEAGLEDEFDMVVVVYVPESVQRARLVTRDGRGDEDADRRIASQLPMAQKSARAHVVIDNAGPLEETRAQVNRLIAKLRRQT